MKSEKIHTHTEIKDESPVFCSEQSGERGMNGGQDMSREKEVRVSDIKEGNIGQESKKKSEKQLKRRAERWRDEGDGALADDEKDDDDDDDDVVGGDDEEQRSGSVFVPLLKIKAGTKQIGCDVRADDVRADNDITHEGKCKPQEHGRNCSVCCSERMRSVLFFIAGLVMFPLLVWAGHDLLPLDVPLVKSAPFRLVYTLRCALFAIFPIVLGVFVHGVSCLKFSSLNPLFEGRRVNRHTVVHMTYVQDSLRLFLLFVLQLAVVSTYVHQSALKLIPLFTIVFVFGRLIYWPSVCFGSSVCVLGFSLSFLPVLTLMGLNLYFICSSSEEGAVFNVAPPTTPPPPKVRWWG